MGGGGNKKNKRGSIITRSQSSSASPDTELIERTLENDYGVMSDPDESTPVHLLIQHKDKESEAAEAAEAEAATATATAAATTLEESSMNHSPSEPISLEDKHNQSEPSPSTHSSLHSSPSLQPLSLPSQQDQSPSLQPQIPQTSTSKSITALQLKLSGDKNFSRKITLHTFFSYIILAMEMERASSASIARISPDRVQHLIEYMIENHTETPAVRTYLHTLVDTGVIKSLIESILEFNKDQTDAFNKLLTTEQLELELASIQEGARTAEAVSVAAANRITEPRQDSMATRIRNFFKRCCCCCCSCCCRPRRANVATPAPSPPPASELKDPEMTPAHPGDSTV